MKRCSAWLEDASLAVWRMPPKLMILVFVNRFNFPCIWQVLLWNSFKKAHDDMGGDSLLLMKKDREYDGVMYDSDF